MGEGGWRLIQVGYGLDKKTSGISPRKTKRLHKHIYKETHPETHPNQLKCHDLSGYKRIG